VAGLIVLAACCAAVGGCDGAPHDWHLRTVASPVRFSALDPRSGAKLTLVETRIPAALSFAQFARNEPKMIRRALHPRRLQVQKGASALRVAYSIGSVSVLQSFFLSRNRMYVVTYTIRSR
jgi:hypothetical protein